MDVYGRQEQKGEVEIEDKITGRGEREERNGIGKSGYYVAAVSRGNTK